MHLLQRSVRIGLILVLVAATQAPAARSLKPRLSSFWDDWLAEVGLLLSDEERAHFEALEDNRMRESFAAAFWASRGQATLERWSRNRSAADQARPRSVWARRAILLFGKPASIERIEPCGGLLPLQIWRWDPWHVERQGGEAERSLVLVLAQETRLLPGSFTPWDPSDVRGLGYYPSADVDLTTYLEKIKPSTCVASRLRDDLASASRFEELRETMPWPEPAAHWLANLSTGADLFGTLPEASLKIDYTGTNGRHTIVHGVLRVGSERLAELVPGQLFDRVSFVGDIYKRGYLVDSFDVVHHVAGTPPGEIVELDLFRGLRPGHYQLDLRVSDGHGLTLLRTQRDLDVPRLDTPAPPPPGRQQDYGQLTRSEVVLLDTLPSVEILPVAARATAETDLLAITTGGPISKVVFYVDDALAGEDSSSPYSLEVRLTDERHLVKAEALDHRGRPLASHSREVAAQARPFAVHIERPVDGADLAPVQLSIPEGSELDRLHCYDGRLLVDTLDGAPFECPTPRLEVGGLRYMRALATLSNGESTEHIIFFGPNAPERIDVQLVELFLSVVDAAGRPVAGLSPTDFRIADAGLERQLVRLESLANRPLSIAVLMDLSSSMGRLARLAAESAERFFENVMVDDDLASLLAFNDDFHQLVPFTGDIAELRLGATELHALGSTRLHDGIVWALSQYAGQDNRRALVILSDGADVNSDFPFDQVVAAAVEAGVVVYPISIVRPREEAPVRLEQLAESTGGSRSIVSSIAELDAAYRRIAEELRSQYLLVYRLEDENPGLGPRSVDVEVLRSDLEVRNVHGYYQ